MPTKIFIVDTNLPAHDPTALLKFEEHDIVVPLTVIEEMDGLKKGLNEVGRNVRFSMRQLDGLRQFGRLDKGVSLGDGKGTLQIVIPTQDMLAALPSCMPPDVKDNQILAVARWATGNWPDREVVFVSKDLNARVKGEALGLSVEDYENGKVDIDELYTGTAELFVTQDELATLYGEGSLLAPSGHKFEPNQCITLINEVNLNNTGLGRYVADIDAIIKIDIPIPPMDLVPRNREQEFLLDLLMDDELKLVTVLGKAGCGKTLCALAAGLHKVMEDELYKRVIVARPVVALGGQELGFLPGDEQEKIAPWMQPIFDNVEILMPDYSQQEEFVDMTRSQRKKFSAQQEKMAGKTSPADELIRRGYLELAPLAYMRGRSIPDQLLIIDEAQNLTPHEVKTIITRAGEGTKVILTGDPQQIDNPYIDASSNGLTYCVEKFKDQPIAGHLTLLKGERSELATIAADIL